MWCFGLVSFYKMFLMFFWFTERQKRYVKRSRWHLGMRSKNRPADVMTEVFRTLHSLNFEWKVITPYHIRCRCWNQVSNNMVKMSLRLYKADSQHYLLDFQNLQTKDSEGLQAIDDDVEGDADSSFYTMEFFELCTLVIKELGA
eukprot:m.60047 g.60047  ORF g.60047 m.60047 type:complete len:144 (+) comp11348_c0_seq3:72-503(+)